MHMLHDRRTAWRLASFSQALRTILPEHRAMSEFGQNVDFREELPGFDPFFPRRGSGMGLLRYVATAARIYRAPQPAETAQHPPCGDNYAALRIVTGGQNMLNGRDFQ